MLSYRMNRSAKVKRLRGDLARITAEQDKTRTAETEVSKLMKLFPADNNSAAFIETLYSVARESGLKQHEVSSETDKGATSARPGGAEAASAIAKHLFKVNASGSYRSFAEYMRRVQNIERFNRITDFKLIPDATQLKGTLTIELYSLPVKR